MGIPRDPLPLETFYMEIAVFGKASLDRNGISSIIGISSPSV